MWGRLNIGDIMNIDEMTSKQISDELRNHGVNMHFNSKREKLVQALENINNSDEINITMNTKQSTAKTDEEIAAEMGVTILTDDMIDNYTYNGIELEGLQAAEGLSLIRVVVRPNDPLKVDAVGDIFTVGSNVINDGQAVKKYIPYNNDEGWHIPKILYNHLKAAECQIFARTTRNGQEVMEPKNIKAYNVEVLPPLTPEEIDKLRVKQKATGSVG